MTWKLKEQGGHVSNQTWPFSSIYNRPFISPSTHGFSVWYLEGLAYDNWRSRLLSIEHWLI